MAQDITFFSKDSLQGYAAARKGAALIDRSRRGRLVVSGPDRAAFLQGLLTNDIVALKPGQGCYAVYLTPQGRMITDLLVYELGDLLLLAMGVEVKDAMLARLDQLVFSEDVQLGDTTDQFGGAAIVGPDAARLAANVLSGIARNDLSGFPEHANARAGYAGAPVIVLRIDDAGVPGFEILVERARHAALMEELRGAGAIDLDSSAAEALRIEAGIPRFGADMDAETIPLEAGIESRAISFTKGCYVGQEVIIRVLHRGHGKVARKLVGLTVQDGGTVAAGAAVTADAADARTIGQITSSSFSPRLARPIALGYVHREFTAPGTAVHIDGVSAAVSALPFV
jgi:folate-binding protein YgfZ